MPEHRLRLDPHNPGQFFACCGLFELSELVAPGGEAWFAHEGCEFVLFTDASVPPRCFALEPQPDLRGKLGDPKLEPLVLVAGDHRLVLNWWLNNTLTEKSRLKTWGAWQTPRGVLGKLLDLLDPGTSFESIFQAFAYTKSRFGVDARSAWDALDAGYSPNDLGQDGKTFPWVEVLAVAGLQGFRPVPETNSRYRYSIWLTPLTIAVARAGCAAPWAGLPSRSFRFEIAGRGQGFKTFLFAKGVDHV